MLFQAFIRPLFICCLFGGLSAYGFVFNNWKECAVGLRLTWPSKNIPILCLENLFSCFCSAGFLVSSVTSGLYLAVNDLTPNILLCPRKCSWIGLMLWSCFSSPWKWFCHHALSLSHSGLLMLLCGHSFWDCARLLIWPLLRFLLFFWWVYFGFSVSFALKCLSAS